MSLEKNVDRMFWRLSKGNFTPNQNDIKAMTEIVHWINREKEKSRKENVMFAKLYCHVFIQEIEFYKDIKFAQRKIHEILQVSIVKHYEDFCSRLNTVELNKFYNEIGLTDKHPAFKSNEEIEMDKEILKKHQNQYIEMLNGVWSYEQVQKSLNNQITEAINKYKNLL
jgi:hypothetical protein